MSQLTARRFEEPDEVRDLGGMGTLEIVRIGDTVASRATFLPGWRWSEHIRPIVGGESCQVDHGAFYIVSGRIHVRMDDGTEAEFGAGDIAAIGPGHDAWVVGDEAVVQLDTSPSSAEYAKPPTG
jgi:mannose-6-phosphate isomerase-like protein (cupin superfamily)